MNLNEFLAYIEKHYVTDGVYSYAHSDSRIDSIFQLSFGTVEPDSYGVMDDVDDKYWKLIEYWWRFGEVDTPGVMEFEKLSDLALNFHFLDPFLKIFNGVPADDVLEGLPLLTR